MKADQISSNMSDTTPNSLGSTSKLGARIQADDISGDGFDGTANLTTGPGTILIPAPTADPQGETLRE
jgi:hypothetical protein